MNHISTLLQEMDLEQKKAFVQILGLKQNDDKEIVSKISKLLLPAKGLFQDPLNYKQFIISIAEKNGENIDISKGILHAERELYLKLFQNEFEKLSQEEKDKIIEELGKAGLDKNQIASLSGIGALGAAQLSGFGIYMLASSTVGAITSLLGITLPFALYTGMSSAISFVIGPVGFLVMGVMLYRSFKHVKSWSEAQEILLASWNELGTLVKGDFAKGTQIFKYIAASRIVLETNYAKEIEENEIDAFGRKAENLENEYLNLDSKISSVENEVMEMKSSVSDLKIEILQLEKQINNIGLEISDCEAEMNSLKNSQTKIEDEKRSLLTEINSIKIKSSQLNQKLKNITQ
jgi:hypothetical protein